jgi:hypothetical protein
MLYAELRGFTEGADSSILTFIDDGFGQLAVTEKGKIPPAAPPGQAPQPQHKCKYMINSNLTKHNQRVLLVSVWPL